MFCTYYSNKGFYYYMTFFMTMFALEISCIKDLMSQYEAGSVESIYLAYDQLRVDDNSLYSCVETLEPQAGNEVTNEDELHEGFLGVIRRATPTPSRKDTHETVCLCLCGSACPFCRP